MRFDVDRLVVCCVERIVDAWMMGGCAASIEEIVERAWSRHGFFDAQGRSLVSKGHVLRCGRRSSCERQTALADLWSKRKGRPMCPGDVPSKSAEQVVSEHRA